MHTLLYPGDQKLNEDCPSSSGGVRARAYLGLVPVHKLPTHRILIAPIIEEGPDRAGRGTRPELTCGMPTIGAFRVSSS